MDATNLEQIGVYARALKDDHLPVIDGQVRKIVNIARVQQRVIIVHTGPSGLEQLARHRADLVPCVRRADWAAAMNAMDAAAGAR